MKDIFSRRDFLRGVGAVAGGASLLSLSTAAGQSSSRPNILYIMADDHAYQTIGCYATMLGGVVRTPNIDRIAKEGTRLDNCFVTNSICAPSRATILTGQYSHINGVRVFNAIDPKRQNVAKLLKNAGYQTAIVGKWHLETEPKGFDYWNVLPGQGRYHNPIMNEKDVGTQTYKGHSADVITDLSPAWIERRDRYRPFMLMCHFKAAHENWSPAERFAELHKDAKIPEPANLLDEYANDRAAAKKATLKLEKMFTRGELAGHNASETAGMTLSQTRRYVYQEYMKQYLRCIAGIDENVGRVLDYLDKNALTENTMVIYTSDQGHFQGEHGFYDKRFMYEEALRMPFVARYSKEIKAGSTNDDIIINADFAPLFLDYAGLGVPDDMQGRSFRRNLAGRTPEKWRRAMYYRYWLHRPHCNVPAHFGVRTKEYKLIFFYGLPMGLSEKPATTPTWELYDLGKDPSEMRNVYGDPGYATVVKELKEQLVGLRKEFEDTDENCPEMKRVIEQYW